MGLFARGLEWAKKKEGGVPTERMDRVLNGNEDTENNDEEEQMKNLLGADFDEAMSLKGAREMTDAWGSEDGDRLDSLLARLADEGLTKNEVQTVKDFIVGGAKYTFGEQ